MGNAIGLSDDILETTRATLVELSRTDAIISVLEALVTLLEEIRRPYDNVASHPQHILLSETYIANLAADACCASLANCGNALYTYGSPSLHQLIKFPAIGTHDISNVSLGSGTRADFDVETDVKPLVPSLDDKLVRRLFDALRNILEPPPDSFSLPSNSSLEEIAQYPTSSTIVTLTHLVDASEGNMDKDSFTNLMLAMDKHARQLVEYVTQANWNSSLTYLKEAIYNVRSAPAASTSHDVVEAHQDADRTALVMIRLLAFFWVNSQKLSFVIQELCSSYLHLQRNVQNAIALVTPLLINRWISRFPTQFVQLHVLHKRLDGGADTLFDMTQTGTEGTRRRSSLFPLQTSLLFLLPDVFEVASNLREAKSNSVAKKVAFLDGLRKAMRSSNEQAAHCLVSLLHAARNFDFESDSALLSYALDVQDEVREAIFQRSADVNRWPILGQSLITAAFISLTHLNLEGCVNNLMKTCTSVAAPHKFKIAVVEACRYFAQQSEPVQYQRLFDIALPFMRFQLEVCWKPEHWA